MTAGSPPSRPSSRIRGAGTPAGLDAERAEAERRRAERAAVKARKEKRRNAIFRAARSTVRWLPLPVASALGEVFGRVVWYAVPWIRRQTLRNLELAWGAEMPPAERRRTGRRCFGITGRGFFAWIVLHRMGPDRAFARVTPEACPEAQALFDAGKGFIFLAPHSGLIELAGCWAAKHLGAIALSRDGDDAGFSLVMEMRKEFGFRTIQTDNPRELVRTLRSGGRVVMLVDQDYRRVPGAFVPFFGRPAHTPVGLATMAVRLRLPVVHVVSEWRTFTRHTLRFPEVLHARTDLPEDEAILELTAQCTAAVERTVRRRPAEWFWFHERWRSSPETRPDAPVWPRDPQASVSADGPGGGGAT